MSQSYSDSPAGKACRNSYVCRLPCSHRFCRIDQTASLILLTASTRASFVATNIGHVDEIVSSCDAERKLLLNLQQPRNARQRSWIRCHEAQEPAPGQIRLQRFDELIRRQQFQDFQAMVPLAIVPAGEPLVQFVSQTQVSAVA